MSEQGTRIRYQPKSPDGRNPDWNWAAGRWKDEADYYADELSTEEVIARAGCPHCGASAGRTCVDTAADFHTPRRRAAGEVMLEQMGPRFS